MDNSLKVEEVETYYDPGELLGGLLSGAHPNYHIEDHAKPSASSQGCPFSK